MEPKTLTARRLMDARVEAMTLQATLNGLLAAARYNSDRSDLQFALDANRDTQRYLAAAYMTVKADEIAARRRELDAG